MDRDIVNMSNRRTETVDTRFGQVTVDVVDCDSCEETVKFDDSHDFIINDKKGHACNICFDTGPLKFPKEHKQSLKEIWDDDGKLIAIFGGVLLMMLISLSLLIIVVVI